MRGNVGQLGCRTEVLSTFGKEADGVPETPDHTCLRTRRCRKKKSTKLVKKQKLNFDINKINE